MTRSGWEKSWRIVLDASMGPRRAVISRREPRPRRCSPLSWAAGIPSRFCVKAIRRAVTLPVPPVRVPTGALLDTHSVRAARIWWRRQQALLRRPSPRPWPFPPRHCEPPQELGRAQRSPAQDIRGPQRPDRRLLDPGSVSSSLKSSAGVNTLLIGFCPFGSCEAMFEGVSTAYARWKIRAVMPSGSFDQLHVARGKHKPQPRAAPPRHSRSSAGAVAMRSIWRSICLIRSKLAWRATARMRLGSISWSSA